MSRRHKAHISDCYSTLPDRKVVSTDEATVNLILAIRKQAIQDDRLDDWNCYWLSKSKIAKTLYLILYTSAAASQRALPEFGVRMERFNKRA